MMTDLGPVLASGGRTPGQNAGAGCLVLIFVALPVGVLGWASTASGYLAGGVLTVVMGGAVFLIARQVLPNWDVRWTLHERGFVRTRRGATERHAYAEVQAIRFRPAREALVVLADGRALLIEGFAGSEALALRLDECVGRATLPAVEHQLATTGRVVLGPLALTATALEVSGQSIAWREVVVREAEITAVVPGNTSQVWSISRRGEAQAIDVSVGEVPLPWVARTLLERGCRNGCPMER